MFPANFLETEAVVPEEPARTDANAPVAVESVSSLVDAELAELDGNRSGGGVIQQHQRPRRVTP